MAFSRRTAPPPPAPSVPTPSQGYADVSELDKYKLVSNIGKGSFGVISKVQRIEDGKEFALKQLDYSKMTEKDRKQILAEVAILSSLKHKNIVQLIQKISDPKNERIYIVMEYCTSGDLGSLIRKAQRSSTPLNEDKIWNIFLQIVLALHHCHCPDSRGSKTSRQSNVAGPSSEGRYQVLHRDLKPENVFLSDDFVKLGDFGLSKDMGTAAFTSTYVGTPLYMPPEILAENRYDTKSDIWSLGCLVFELCALSSPFSTAQTQAELIAMVKSGKLPPLPAHISPTLKGVIKAMLTLNPAKRPSTKDLLDLDEMKMHRKLFTLQNQTNLLYLRKEELSKAESNYQNRINHLKQVEESLQAKEEELRVREAALDARETKMVEKEVLLADREEEIKDTQKRLAAAAENLRTQWDRMKEEKERERSGPFSGLPMPPMDERAPARRGSIAPVRPPLEERNTMPVLTRHNRPSYAFEDTPSKIPVNSYGANAPPVPFLSRLQDMQIGEAAPPTPLRKNNTKSLGNLREMVHTQPGTGEQYESTPAKQTSGFPKSSRVSIGSPNDLRQVYSEDISMALATPQSHASPWVPRPRRDSTGLIIAKANGGNGFPSTTSAESITSSNSAEKISILPPTMIPVPVPTYTYREAATPAKYAMDDPDLPSPFLKRFPSDPTPTQGTLAGNPPSGERQVLGNINHYQNQIQVPAGQASNTATQGPVGMGMRKPLVGPRKPGGGGLHAQVLQRNAAIVEKERRTSGENVGPGTGSAGMSGGARARAAVARTDAQRMLAG